jgi:hypothetical protein
MRLQRKCRVSSNVIGRTTTCPKAMSAGKRPSLVPMMPAPIMTTLCFPSDILLPQQLLTSTPSSKSVESARLQNRSDELCEKMCGSYEKKVFHPVEKTTFSLSVPEQTSNSAQTRSYSETLILSISSAGCKATQGICLG